MTHKMNGTIIILLGTAWLMTAHIAAIGQPVINEAYIIDKDQETKVISGCAQAGSWVYFGASAKCGECPTHELEYTWDFGDGETAKGAFVTHPYLNQMAGVRKAYVTVVCKHGKTQKGPCTVYVIRDIALIRIGEEAPPVTYRISFNDVNQVKAVALPYPFPEEVDDLIDWHLYVGSYAIDVANDRDPLLILPPGKAWPRWNIEWKGPRLLIVSIDGPFVRGQEDELVTGKASFIGMDCVVQTFYQAVGQQNPKGDVPNWFYYYKDYEGGKDYRYDGTLKSSETTPGIRNSTRIANTAYAGGFYYTHDYGNPGGRLRMLGYSGVFRYLRYFMGVVKHQRAHQQHLTWRQKGGPLDPDGDFLASDFERTVSKTDPADRISASGNLAPPEDPVEQRWFLDAEFYANGPVEKEGIDAENGDQDWVHPGSNWP